jgi:hypothetical protein
MFEQAQPLSIAEAPAAELAADCRQINDKDCEYDEGDNGGLDEGANGGADEGVDEQVEKEEVEEDGAQRMIEIYCVVC